MVCCLQYFRIIRENSIWCRYHWNVFGPAWPCIFGYKRLKPWAIFVSIFDNCTRLCVFLRPSLSGSILFISARSLTCGKAISVGTSFQISVHNRAAVIRGRNCPNTLWEPSLSHAYIAKTAELATNSAGGCGRTRTGIYLRLREFLRETILRRACLNKCGAIIYADQTTSVGGDFFFFNIFYFFFSRHASIKEYTRVYLLLFAL